MMPVRRMIGASGNSALISGSSSPFCHCALLVVSTTGMSKALADLASATTLFLYSASEAWSCTPDISPTWWSTSSSTLFSGVGRS